jgi:hypothetical protein
MKLLAVPRNPLKSQRKKTGNYFRVLATEHNDHFGPKVRIPDLFHRKDQVYLNLDAQKLQWLHPPPTILYHDLLDAAAKVGHIEEQIGYIFKDKMKCIEALKVTSAAAPLYYNGLVQRVERNNRQALLGDRVLSLALTELWYHAGHTTGMFNISFYSMS